MLKQVMKGSLLIVLSSLFLGAIISEASEKSQEYKGNAEVSFYGRYEYPGPDKPDGSQIEKVEKDPVITVPNDSVHEKVVPIKNQLPMTGEEKSNMFRVGCTLIFFILLISLTKRYFIKERNK